MNKIDKTDRKMPQRSSKTFMIEYLQKQKELLIDTPYLEKRKKKNLEINLDEECTSDSYSSEIEYDHELAEQLALSKLASTIPQLETLSKTITQKIEHYKKQFLQEVKDNEQRISNVPPLSVPISEDIRVLNWEILKSAQLKFGGRLFDAIMMDPPWQLSSAQPSRGVAIAYNSLADDFISQIPIPSLQTDGYLFIWVINAKYSFACSLMKTWGYNLVDEIVWVKKTVNGKIAKGHGFYLQHAKESCLVGYKGSLSNIKGVCSDVIFSERRGQSQKPEEIYETIEKLVPNGFYLEIFGRRNNLRSKWVTIGNEIQTFL